MKTTKLPSWKALDKRWSILVRQRDPVCRFCKKNPSRQAHHLIGRAYRSTRYDLVNGLGTCGGCHIRIEGLGLMFTLWFKEEYPLRFDYLTLAAFKPICQLKEKDKLPIIEQFDKAERSLS